ncbi:MULTISPECIES: globin domain-containing protein [unclassified Streptomyces]|uniref:globin domain-containing protein n=1 Tax=unclassified Streptomyces TaxID=2593676 RepID=UPI002E27FDC0|nr:globin domain-containing protein [Streptomyces sp. NBC_00223]
MLEPPVLVPLADDEIALLRASVDIVGPFAGEMTVYFYAILFTRYPQVRQLFPADMDVQRDRLLRGLLRIVDLVDDPDNLVRFCSRLGRDHRKFGALDGHYPAVGECLLASLARFAGPAWSADLAGVWTRAYQLVAQVMTFAAEQDALVSPAVWPAEVIHHVQRGHGIAEVTLRPESPYPYIAGQYAGVETPWQPRAWRYYSPAHAPREDNTLTFHVRAVPGGRVSQALVHRAKPGDQVQLGPVQGDMTLDPNSDRDLVCVAGGTGMAPIRALVEQAARDGTERYVDVFVGARTADELYGLDDMLRMSQRHHWLSVRAAVSHERIVGLEGTLPEVLGQFGPWYQHDAFLSGPVEMVTQATNALIRQGVPREWIHRDPFDVPALEAELLPRRTPEDAM